MYDPDANEWSSAKLLKMPDEEQFVNCGAGCVQRCDLANGDILLPVYFKKPQDKQYSVTVCLCRFDGKQLTYVKHGNELTVPVDRGMVEPSVTEYRGRYYLTIRNDQHGYVTSSDDGLHYDAPRQWTFDDGSDLGSYNTQQHWLTHSDGLFLVYTRRGANNDHVFRHRAPLFVAQVDPETLAVIRSTERIVVPERGARLGNFGVANVTPDESWIVVTEWMQRWGPDYVIPVDNKTGSRQQHLRSKNQMEYAEQPQSVEPFPNLFQQRRSSMLCISDAAFDGVNFEDEAGRIFETAGIPSDWLLAREIG